MPGRAAGRIDLLDGFRLGGAKAVGAVAQRLRHRIDDVVGQRGDERDDHDAHDQPGRQRRFRSDIEPELGHARTQGGATVSAAKKP